MIETKDILKMVQHIVKRDQGIADTNIMHPIREWLVGIGVTLALVLVGGWLAFYLYSSNDAKKSVEIPVIEVAVPYKAATVAAAINQYKTKQEAYKKLLDSGRVIEVASSTPVTETENETVPENISEQTATTTVVSEEETETIPEMITDPAPLELAN